MGSLFKFPPWRTGSINPTVFNKIQMSRNRKAKGFFVYHFVNLFTLNYLKEFLGFVGQYRNATGDYDCIYNNLAVKIFLVDNYHSERNITNFRSLATNFNQA